jgi:putative spermidine/putrescine transport system ATP-binding protein
MSVAANLAFGLQLRGVKRREADARVEEALAVVRLEALGGRMPKQLSGGQQQRVALARALVIRPDVLLLDEPLSNLDAKLREDMRIEIRDMQLRLGITTVFVTHDQAEALAMSDRVAMMHAGRIVQCGTPMQIYEHPATEAVAEFIGRVNQMRGRVTQSTADRSLVEVDGVGSIWVPGCLPQGRGATVMVRPHRTRVVAADAAPDAASNRLPAKVDKAVYTGDQVQVVAHAGPVVFLSEGPSHLPDWQSLTQGTPVLVEWSIADTMGFPAAA